jgi:hypothetical protein
VICNLGQLQEPKSYFFISQGVICNLGQPQGPILHLSLSFNNDTKSKRLLTLPRLLNEMMIR